MMLKATRSYRAKDWTIAASRFKSLIEFSLEHGLYSAGLGENLWLPYLTSLEQLGDWDAAIEGAERWVDLTESEPELDRGQKIAARTVLARLLSGAQRYRDSRRQFLKVLDLTREVHGEHTSLIVPVWMEMAEVNDRLEDWKTNREVLPALISLMEKRNFPDDATTRLRELLEVASRHSEDE